MNFQYINKNLVYRNSRAHDNICHKCWQKKSLINGYDQVVMGGVKSKKLELRKNVTIECGRAPQNFRMHGKCILKTNATLEPAIGFWQLNKLDIL